MELINSDTFYRWLYFDRVIWSLCYPGLIPILYELHPASGTISYTHIGS